MSLASGDLTTLPTAQAYIDSPPSAQVLTGLIQRVSRSVHGMLNRPLLVPKSYVEQFDGTGTTQLVLPNWPVTVIAQVKVSGSVLSLAPQVDQQDTVATPYGYRVQPWNGLPPGDPAVVELICGAFFLKGHQNVVVSYTAGYQVSNEAQTVPAQAPFSITPVTPYGIWATDQGVQYASTQTALVGISAGTPAIGQYVPPNPNANPPVLNYTFAVADAGQSMLISYGFVPGEIEQVVLELVAERAIYRKRIGVRSQSLAGQEMITYSDWGLSPWAVDALMPYCSVIPQATGAPV